MEIRGRKRPAWIGLRRARCSSSVPMWRIPSVCQTVTACSAAVIRITMAFIQTAFCFPIQAATCRIIFRKTDGRQRISEKSISHPRTGPHRREKALSPRAPGRTAARIITSMGRTGALTIWSLRWDTAGKRAITGSGSCKTAAATPCMKGKANPEIRCAFPCICRNVCILPPLLGNVP